MAQTQQERLEVSHSQEPEPDWSKLLRMLVEGGFWREDRGVHHGRFRLPRSFRGKPSGNGEAATMLAHRYDLPLEFAEAAEHEVSSAGEGESAAPVPCVGRQLIARRVQWPAADGFITGKVIAYCEVRDVYSD